MKGLTCQPVKIPFFLERRDVLDCDHGRRLGIDDRHLPPLVRNGLIVMRMIVRVFVLGARLFLWRDHCFLFLFTLRVQPILPSV